jgi:drug/metabolite transporter (DMT)-like permease
VTSDERGANQAAAPAGAAAGGETSAAQALRQRRLALGAALITIALWASAFVGIRSAGRDLSPGALTLFRLLVGSIALGILMLARGERFPARRALPGIAVCGLLWFGVYNIALNAAEQRVDAGTAAMLINVAPIFTAALAGIILREGFPRSLLMGSALAFVGVLVIGLATSERGVHAGWGAALCLIAALGAACGQVAQKPVLAHASALQVTWLACTVGALACLPFAPTLAHDLGDARGSTIAAAFYLGALPTAVAFTTWAYALARTTAGRMAAMTYLAPPLAIVMGWAILGETPPALAFAGGALCLAGVGITRGQLPRLRSAQVATAASKP